MSVQALMWFEIVYKFDDGGEILSRAVTTNIKPECLIDIVTGYLQDASAGPRDPGFRVVRQSPSDKVYRIKVGLQSPGAKSYVCEMQRDQEAHNDVGDVWGLEDNCEDRAMRIGIILDALSQMERGQLKAETA